MNFKRLVSAILVVCGLGMALGAYAGSTDDKNQDNSNNSNSKSGSSGGY
jgi:hypothetical protein